MAAWVIIPDTLPGAVLLFAAGALLAVRLARWRGLATSREPILIVLHLGYGWLAVSLLLLGLAALVPAIPQSAALHALAAAAVGTMTLAIMTRASLGHTGGAIVADRSMIAMYVIVSAGALAPSSCSLRGRMVCLRARLRRDTVERGVLAICGPLCPHSCSARARERERKRKNKR